MRSGLEECGGGAALVVALWCEARPIVDRLELERDDTADGLPVYRGDRGSLVVSGVGELAAAAAAGFLFAHLGCRRHRVWLNVGTAGHGSFDVGTLFLAHKITGSGGQSGYPPICFEASVVTSDLETVSEVETRYERPVGYDMEAWGFWATACRFSTSELVHSVKVVSDNARTEVSALDARRLEQLVEGSLEGVEAVLAALERLGREQASLELPEALLKRYEARWRFTVTQRRQLERALERWLALEPEQGGWSHEIETLRQGREVLRVLNERLLSRDLGMPQRQERGR